MGKSHVIRNAVSSILVDPWDVHQEARGHADQGLTRPCMEPIKHCTIDQGWELPGPDAEFVSNGAEAEHHMQVFPDLVNEEVPTILGGVYQA